jgi:hypothetical protein
MFVTHGNDTGNEVLAVNPQQGHEQAIGHCCRPFVHACPEAKTRVESNTAVQDQAPAGIG